MYALCHKIHDTQKEILLSFLNSSDYQNLTNKLKIQHILLFLGGGCGGEEGGVEMGKKGLLNLQDKVCCSN